MRHCILVRCQDGSEHPTWSWMAWITAAEWRGWPIEVTEVLGVKLYEVKEWEEPS